MLKIYVLYFDVIVVWRFYDLNYLRNYVKKVVLWFLFFVINFEGFFNVIIKVFFYNSLYLYKYKSI